MLYLLVLTATASEEAPGGFSVGDEVCMTSDKNLAKLSFDQISDITWHNAVETMLGKTHTIREISKCAEGPCLALDPPADFADSEVLWKFSPGIFTNGHCEGDHDYAAWHTRWWVWLSYGIFLVLVFGFSFFIARYTYLMKQLKVEKKALSQGDQPKFVNLSMPAATVQHTSYRMPEVRPATSFAMPDVRSSFASATPPSSFDAADVRPALSFGPAASDTRSALSFASGDGRS